ncbi:hypothetical protein [Halomarina litorea]|uniref:hypothetical protein n=1 Tax=Halomarina litorea TaxID=2961595 RepID=UPI0020C1CD8E|nr:hypothetical protein [Halomarina sp. BCD28]
MSTHADADDSSTAFTNNPFADVDTHVTPTAVVNAFTGASTIFEVQRDLRVPRHKAKHLAGELGLRASHPGAGIAKKLDRAEVEEAVAQYVRAHRESKSEEGR